MDLEHLPEAIDDLNARLDTAGRDTAGIDIVFANPVGGDPSTDGFDADAHLEGIGRLAALGVTWVQVGLPSDSLTHITETLQRYGEQVIAQL